MFYVLSIKHNNKIALRVGWKICCRFLAVIVRAKQNRDASLSKQSLILSYDSPHPLPQPSGNR